jgi:hypothetical protein
MVSVSVTEMASRMVSMTVTVLVIMTVSVWASVSATEMASRMVSMKV